MAEAPPHAHNPHKKAGQLWVWLQRVSSSKVKTFHAYIKLALNHFGPLVMQALIACFVRTSVGVRFR